jgi:hypothetical protein
MSTTASGQRSTASRTSQDTNCCPSEPRRLRHDKQHSDGAGATGRAKRAVPPEKILISTSRKVFSKVAAPLESGPMLSSTMARRAGTCAFHRGTTAEGEWWAWEKARPAAWAGRLGSLQSRTAHRMAATKMQVTARPLTRGCEAYWAQ